LHRRIGMPGYNVCSVSVVNDAVDVLRRETDVPARSVAAEQAFPAAVLVFSSQSGRHRVSLSDPRNIGRDGEVRFAWTLVDRENHSQACEIEDAVERTRLGATIKTRLPRCLNCRSKMRIPESMKLQRDARHQDLSPLLSALISDLRIEFRHCCRCRSGR
jgi:hypothetical protein